jgi:hypothetical protein
MDYISTSYVHSAINFHLFVKFNCQNSNNTMHIHLACVWFHMNCHSGTVMLYMYAFSYAYTSHHACKELAGQQTKEETTCSLVPCYKAKTFHKNILHI